MTMPKERRSVDLAPPSSYSAPVALRSQGQSPRHPRDTVDTASQEERIIDKIQARISAGEPFFSLEFFTPRSAVGAANLVQVRGSKT